MGVQGPAGDRGAAPHPETRGVGGGVNEDGCPRFFSTGTAGMGRSKTIRPGMTWRLLPWPVAIAALCVGVVSGLVIYASVGREVQRPATEANAAPSASQPEHPVGCCDPVPAGDDAYRRLPLPETAQVPDAGQVEPTVVHAVPPPEAAPESMAWIPPGTFSMGSASRRSATLVPFTPSNSTASGWTKHRSPTSSSPRSSRPRVTSPSPRRRPDRKDFPECPTEKLVPGSLVFSPPRSRSPR